MIIVFGHQHYGRVDGHGPEYMATRFAHVYWLPLVPTGSRWVTRRHGDDLLGFDVPLSGRSVAAAYLRIWAPIVAAGAIATLSIIGFAVAAALLALSGWSWTWRRARGARDARRAAFHQVAFGSACDPLRRSVLQCEMLRLQIDEQYAKVSGGRTPDDVARFGADTPMQAVLAYGVQRLVAATARGDTARKARAASERILDGLKESDAGALAEGGPYRAKAAAPDVVASAIETAAASSVEAYNHIDEPPRRVVTAWENDPNNPAVQDEIARNKKLRGGPSRVTVFFLVVAGVVGGGFLIYHEVSKRLAADQALGEIRGFRDDFCKCPTRACMDDLVNARIEAVERAEAVALEVKSNASDLEDLRDDVVRCLTAVSP